MNTVFPDGKYSLPPFQILNIEELINDERKFMGSNTEEKIENSLAKRLRVTENRLDQVSSSWSYPVLYLAKQTGFSG